MSYLVLARKYRPKSFSEMVGQAHVVRALGNALDSGRLHHAYLFTGTRGVGKTTVSRILAKSLNCIGADGTGGVTSQPCGVCQACRDIDAGHFVDYTELDAASNRGVEDVQALLDQAAYKPVQGRYKVFMIDEVHMLSNTAFNAMLKTLEEPPEFLKFVLATTDPQKVPVTVLSRCLQFALRPMAPETITAHLVGILKEEQIVHDTGSLQLLAQSARGSMRDALSLTDQAIAYGAGVLQEAGVRTMLGAVDKSHATALLQALLDADGLALVQIVAVLRENGLAATMVLDELSAWLQRIAVLQLGTRRGGKSSHVDAAQSESGQSSDDAQMLAFAAGFAKDEVQLLYSICLQGKQDLGWASDEYSALTMVLLRYLAFLPEGEGDSEKKKPDSVAQSSLTVAASLEPSASAVASPVDSTQAPSPASYAIPLAPLTTSTVLTGAASVSPATSPEGLDSAAVKPLLALPVRSMAVNALGDGALDARIQLEPPSAAHEKWQALVAQWVESGAVTAMASQLAVQSQCMNWTESHITLRVEQNTLNNEGAKQKLWDALREAGHNVALLVQLGPVASSYAIAQAARKEALQQIATDYVMQSPLVSMVLNDFDGKIIPGSIEVLNSESLEALVH